MHKTHTLMGALCILTSPICNSIALERYQLGETEGDTRSVDVEQHIQ